MALDSCILQMFVFHFHESSFVCEIHKSKVPQIKIATSKDRGFSEMISNGVTAEQGATTSATQRLLPVPGLAC